MNDLSGLLPGFPNFFAVAHLRYDVPPGEWELKVFTRYMYYNGNTYSPQLQYLATQGTLQSLSGDMPRGGIVFQLNNSGVENDLHRFFRSARVCKGISYISIERHISESAQIWNDGYFLPCFNIFGSTRIIAVPLSALHRSITTLTDVPNNKLFFRTLFVGNVSGILVATAPKPQTQPATPTHIIPPPEPVYDLTSPSVFSRLVHFLSS